MEKESRCPVCGTPVPQAGDEKHGVVATFRTETYLNEQGCRQLMSEISKGWQNDSRSQLSRHPIAQFHPVSIEQMKQTRDLDCFAVYIDCAGNIGRTHLVKADGILFLNPPPEDHKCESCHRHAGPLRKHYQVSKIDNTSVPVWLCASCEALTTTQRDVRF